MICKHKEGKCGGGISLFRHRNHKYMVVEQISAVEENVLECLTTEVFKKKKKHNTPRSPLSVREPAAQQNHS